MYYHVSLDILHFLQSITFRMESYFSGYFRRWLYAFVPLDIYTYVVNFYFPANASGNDVGVSKVGSSDCCFC